MSLAILKRMALAAVFCLAASGCSTLPTDGDLTTRPIRIVTTIGMITDIVQNVGGERVAVKGLMGPGVDPHLYKASEGDVIRLQEADLVFYGGLHLEAKMAQVFEEMQDSRIKTVAVTDLIDRSLLLAPPEFKGQYDPHVWFDVTMWMTAVEQIRNTLMEIDPGSAPLYEANATAYLAQLDALNTYVKTQAARVPAEQRVMITAHDAFNYFGRAYGFEVRGLQGISTESQASTADVQALAEFIAERHIPAIFVESSVPQRNVEAVQAAAEARGAPVVIGGSLYSDAMGSPGTPDGTYIGMVTHNIDTIVAALLGNAQPTPTP
jgi:manganese/zinc/iron transport system substrate-binding protein